MGYWIRGKYKIDCSLSSILNKLNQETPNIKITRVSKKDGYSLINCPFHKEGKEKHPSMGIVDTNNRELEFGTFNCFTCKTSGKLEDFVSQILDIDTYSATQWLINNFGIFIDNTQLELEEIKLPTSEPTSKEVHLIEVDYTHPYLKERKLNIDICKKFHVGYDIKTNCIIFPVWNEYDELIMNTRRDTLSKKFYLEKDTEKPVYLLNEILKENIKQVYVCESQINALTLWGWGFPAIALFGTGSSTQYEILNNTSILEYVLCFDGDNAGRKGIYNFLKNINSRCFISIIEIPEGKDVNDLSKEEFEQLNKKEVYKYTKRYYNKNIGD